jgi:hypothetical protein
MGGLEMKTSDRDRLLSNVARFATDRYFHTLVILFAAIVFTFFATKDYIPTVFRLFMPWVLLIMITTTMQRRWVWTLMLSTLMLVINVYLNFYTSANHGFMIAYIGLALLIAISADDEVLMQKMALWFLTALMGLALIQKMSSPYYMSGNLIGDYILTGQMFKNLITVVYPDWVNVVHQNVAAGRELATITPQNRNAVDLVVPTGITMLIMGLTYTSIISQFLMEAALLARSRLGIWVHYALLLFVVIIYSTRNENVFLSMNCILGYALTDEQTKSARKFYVIWIFYLLAMELMGVRPGFLI